MKEVGIRIKVGATGLENVDELIRQMKAAGAETGEFEDDVRQLGAELQKVGREQALIDKFRLVKAEAGKAGDALKEAQAKAGALGRELRELENPTKKQAEAFDRSRKAAREAAEAVQKKRLELQTLRTALGAAGIATDDLAGAQVRVRQQTEAATARARNFREELQRQAAGYRETAAAATASAAKQTASVRDVGGAFDGLQTQLGTVRNLVGVALGGGLATGLIRDVAETADAYNNLASRIKLVTGEGQAFDEAFNGVKQLALETNTALVDTGTLFARVAQAGKDIGLSQQEALQITRTISQAVQISGASAEAGSAAVTQLIQGLQSGVLRGEEFNAVMEQSPRVAQALATGLGVSVAALRELANTGQLTSEKVINALRSQATAVETEFGKLPATVGRAITNLSNQWILFVGQLDSSTGASAKLAAGINTLAENLDSVARVAATTGAVITAALAVQAAGALRAYAVQAAAAAGATNVLAASLSKLPKALNIVVAVSGFEAGYQLGTWLNETSALARKLGVGLTDFVVTLVNDLQLVKDAGAAIFSDDTVGAAFDRFNQRAQVQRRIFAEMYADAAKAPQSVAAATNAAAGSIQQLGVSVKLVGTALENANKQTESLAVQKGVLTKQVEAQEARLKDLTLQYSRERISSEDLKKADDELTKAKDALVKVVDSQRQESDRLVESLKLEATYTQKLIELEITRLKQQRDDLVARGLQYEAKQAGIRIADLEVQSTKAGTDAKRAEADAIIRSEQARQRDLLAIGRLTPEIKAQSDLRIRSAEIQKVEVEITKTGTEAREKHLNQVRAGTKELDANTSSTSGNSGSVDNNTKSVGENTREREKNVKVIDRQAEAAKNAQALLDAPNSFRDSIKERDASVEKAKLQNTFSETFFNTKGGGTLRTANVQLQPPGGGNPDDWVFDSAAFERDTAGGKTAVSFNNAAYWRPKYRGNTGSPFGGSGRPIQSPAPIPSAGPASTGDYTVNVTIGGANYGISAASRSAADLMIKALEEAYRAGGGG